MFGRGDSWPSPIPASDSPQGVKGNDLLYCFEGGTGGIARKPLTHAWSVMGYVLVH